MKKLRIFIFLVLSVIAVKTTMSAELTTEQKRFRSSIESFLKEEGFFPTIDNEDNSLNFKKEGTLYWISVGDSNPFYLEFHIAGFSCEDADKNLVLQAVNAANCKVRCAKAMFKDTSVAFAIEMYSHSSEEFRYVFYKCLKELSNIKEEVSDYYNNGGSSSVSSSSQSNYNNSSALSLFFPVYGITLGKTTINEMRSKGYTVETDADGDSHCDVRGLAFWEFDHDQVFEHIYTTCYDGLPDAWIDGLGINWGLSYNQIISKFKDLGFSIKVDKGPKTVEYSGRNTLDADVTATSSDGHFTVELRFAYGNKNGEGYTTNSSNSLYSMRFKLK